MMFAPDDLTADGFLDGRLRILQPKAGFRSAMDAVLLAAAVPARPGDRVLELGCGAGVASLCLLSRVPGIVAHALERQPAYARLARTNAAANALPLTVEEGDLATMPAALRAQAFDVVFANPPYFASGSGTTARDAGREDAQREDTPLPVWIDAGLRRLRPGGTLVVIQAAERLADLLEPLSGRTGALTILPLVPRAGRPAGRVLVRARKGARAPLRLLSPLVLHAGARHLRDGDDLSPEARAILRDGAPVDW